MNSKPIISIIGRGRLGSVLGAALESAGYTIDWAGRGALAPKGRIIFITTQDQRIAAVAQSLTETHNLGAGTVVIHCSGSLPSAILSPLRDAGVHIASCHPLQTFPDLNSGLAALPGTFWFCEGDGDALSVMKPIVESLQGQMQIIQPAQKMAYHAAVCIAANYMTTLIGAAEIIGAQSGLSPDRFRQALAPILRVTLDNTIRLGARNALTGPVARGDAITIAGHLDALNKLSSDSNDLMDLYKVLAEFTKNHLAVKL